MLPDSSPQLGCDDHKPAAHCTESAADMGWKSCGTGRCPEMFCSGLKERERTDTRVFGCTTAKNGLFRELKFSLVISENANSNLLIHRQTRRAT